MNVKLCQPGGGRYKLDSSLKAQNLLIKEYNTEENSMKDTSLFRVF